MDRVAGHQGPQRAAVPSPLRREIAVVAGLALPAMAGQVGTMLLGVVDNLMLGRLSVEALAASSIANVWIFSTTIVAIGILMGMDPIVGQAHGAGDAQRAALTLQRGSVLSLLLSVVLAALWALTEPVLRALGQEAELARQAQIYTQVQIPSIPFFLGFIALRQYLQARELMRPGMWVVWIANGFNAVLNWVLIFGHWGAPALGLFGSGLATSLTRVLCLALLLAWVLRFGLHRGAWVPWSRAAWEGPGLWHIVAIGLPVATHLFLEVLAFSGSTLLAGWLSTEALAAHTIVLNLAALAFMMPLGISHGATTRIGNLIGAGFTQRAQRAAWVALAMGGGIMTSSAGLFVLARHALPRLYTADPAVLALCASILPIAAAFQIFDGTQVVGCGVLRGMGRTRPAAWFNLFGYWVVGLPVGAWLALRTGLGLAGLWWGLCLGLAIVALLLVSWVALRGPAHLAAPGRRPAPPSATLAAAASPCDGQPRNESSSGRVREDSS